MINGNDVMKKESMKRFGIAGYMGAGKSTCAQLIAGENGTVIDADGVAKRIMNESEAIKTQLVESFGEKCIENGTVVFSVLGENVFRSIDDLERLNRIVHPPLLHELHYLIELASTEKCILDAALIPLWHIETWFTTCIWVHASFETRLSRLKKKLIDVSEEMIRKRMEMQEQLFPEPHDENWKMVTNEECNEQLLVQLHSSIDF